MALAVAALLALPAVAPARQSGAGVDRVAAQQCAKERQDIGRNAFRKKYGGRQGMRNCIRRSRGPARSALQQAQAACQAELSQMGTDAFNDEYGTDDTGSDAFDECVAERLVPPGSDDDSDDSDE